MKMNWQINEFDPSSKIWIYTIHPNLNEQIETHLSAELTEFCKQWTAHNRELRAFFKIIEHTILIMGVDEHLNPASGCSIDKSVHFLEELEKKYSVDFFNRMLFTCVNEEDTFSTHTKTQFESLIQENKITHQTIVVNTLALTLKDWNENGLQTIEKSWMKNFFKLLV
jgi:hypothetical protein